MKKVILLIALVFSSFAIQAQDKSDEPVLIDLVINTLEFNGGVLTHDALSSASRFSLIGNDNIDYINHLNKDLEIGQASIGFSGDFFSSKKFNFGPAGKVYFHEVGYRGGKSSDLNHYTFSLGANAGVDLGKFFFNTSFELPIKGKRENIFEAVVSPSAGFMISDKIGVKANFDYFFNKKLFNYAYTIGGGLIYKF